MKTSYKDFTFVQAFETKTTRIEMWVKPFGDNSFERVIRKVNLNNNNEFIVLDTHCYNEAMEMFYEILYLLKDNGVEIEHYY